MGFSDAIRVGPATIAHLHIPRSIDTSGVDIANLVEGAKIVAPVGYELTWDSSAYSASNFYRLGINAYAATVGDGHLYGSAAGGARVDGGAIYTFDGSVYVPLNVGGVPFVFDMASYVYRSVVDAMDLLTRVFASDCRGRGRDQCPREFCYARRQRCEFIGDRSFNS